MSDLSIGLNCPQADFLALPQRYRALISGFGGGKTTVGCIGQCQQALSMPGIKQGYFAPTYPLISDVYYPAIERVCGDFGLDCKIKVSEKLVIITRRGKLLSEIICRTMEKPERIIGFEIGRALVDEIDTLPIIKARAAWRKIIARLRLKGAPNSIDVTTTPEGYKFVYETFAKTKFPDLYGSVHASTYDNEANLPDGYIQSLFDSYPEKLRDAYLNGRYVNLEAETVYYAFNRRDCNTHETIQPSEALHIGMDFNIGKMAACIGVIRSGKLFVLAEITGLHDTPAMVATIKSRYPGRTIAVYPDASGGSRHTSASETDFQVLRNAGFTLTHNYSNPLVRDRVLGVNLGLERGDILVNVSQCPALVSGLEHQAYTIRGEPDKTTGHDHINDALGYLAMKAVNNQQILRQVSNY